MDEFIYFPNPAITTGYTIHNNPQISHRQAFSHDINYLHHNHLEGEDEENQKKNNHH
jgi:hypothetical protein